MSISSKATCNTPLLSLCLLYKRRHEAPFALDHDVNFLYMLDTQNTFRHVRSLSLSASKQRRTGIDPGGVLISHGCWCGGDVLSA